MKEFLTNLGSVYWWISVVIVGILINIVSTYLVRKLDRRLSSISSWWRKKSEIRKAKRQVELNKLRSNTHEQLMAAFTEIRYRTRGTMWFIWGVLFLLLATFIDRMRPYDLTASILKIITLLIGSLGVLIGQVEFQKANNMQNLLEESSKSENPTTEVEL